MFQKSFQKFCFLVTRIFWLILVSISWHSCMIIHIYPIKGVRFWHQIFKPVSPAESATRSTPAQAHDMHTWKSIITSATDSFQSMHEAGIGLPGMNEHQTTKWSCMSAFESPWVTSHLTALDIQSIRLALNQNPENKIDTARSSKSHAASLLLLFPCRFSKQLWRPHMHACCVCASKALCLWLILTLDFVLFAFALSLGPSSLLLIGQWRLVWPQDWEGIHTTDSPEDPGCLGHDFARPTQLFIMVSFLLTSMNMLTNLSLSSLAPMFS